MTKTTPPLNRRSLILTLFIAPLASIGCGTGGQEVVENKKAGEKRQERVEGIQKNAEEKSKSKGKKGSAR